MYELKPSKDSVKFVEKLDVKLKEKLKNLFGVLKSNPLPFREYEFCTASCLSLLVLANSKPKDAKEFARFCFVSLTNFKVSSFIWEDRVSSSRSSCFG